MLDNGWIRGGEARRVSTLWAAHVYYTGQDTRSRGVSRRIDERITGYTQSAGFEGCIESWICARRECACAGAGALRGLDYGSREEAISGIPGEADSAAAYRPKIEIERIGPDCFPPWNSCFFSGTIFRVVGIFLDGSNLEFFFNVGNNFKSNRY